jgi:hypothetical protein
MNAIDRRSVMQAILGGATVATVATAGVILLPTPIEAAPLAFDKGLADETDDLFQEAQAVVVGPRRRRRRWVCWWRRRRRVCGWRW